ncbi:MAG TPA: hypothetical protein VKZ67_05040 [Natronosporangium sp.]|jgi:hypothetical protein|nr:hypothetical protein [Natronosporangium sp.]
MRPSVIGLMAGIALGFAAAFGGFGAFLAVALLGLLGFLTGRAVEGRFDLSALSGDRSQANR